MAATITNKYSNTVGGRVGPITVSQGEAVVVVLYAADGSLGLDLQAVIERLHNGLYLPVPGEQGTRAMLTRERSEFVLRAPGDYYVNVPATAEAVRVDEVR